MELLRLFTGFMLVMVLSAAPAWAADETPIAPGTVQETVPAPAPVAEPAPTEPAPAETPSEPLPFDNESNKGPDKEPKEPKIDHEPAVLPVENVIDTAVDTSYVPPESAGPGMPPQEPTAPATDKTSAFSMERYATGDSSIAFKSAENVDEDSKTWGLGGQYVKSAPKSSTTFLVTGRVLSVDPYRNAVVVKDQNRKNRTLFLDENETSKLHKGSIVQATVRPGQERAENVRQILGG